MRRLCITILCLFILAGCRESATDIIIPTDSSTWEKDLLPKVKALSEEDQALLLAYLTRAKLAKKFRTSSRVTPVGMTVGQAIHEELKFQEEETARKNKEFEEQKARAEQEKKETEEALNNAVNVVFISKTNTKRDINLNRFLDTVAVEIHLENKSEQEIIGVIAELEFHRKDGEGFFLIGINAAEKIPPKQNIRWVSEHEINRFMKSYTNFFNLEEGKYTVRVVPIRVTFADNTHIEIPGAQRLMFPKPQSKAADKIPKN